jgi:hypothetical protein
MFLFLPRPVPKSQPDLLDDPALPALISIKSAKGPPVVTFGLLIQIKEMPLPA